VADVIPKSSSGLHVRRRKKPKRNASRNLLVLLATISLRRPQNISPNATDEESDESRSVPPRRAGQYERCQLRCTVGMRRAGIQSDDCAIDDSVRWRRHRGCHHMRFSPVQARRHNRNRHIRGAHVRRCFVRIRTKRPVPCGPKRQTMSTLESPYLAVALVAPAANDHAPRGVARGSQRPQAGHARAEAA